MRRGFGVVLALACGAGVLACVLMVKLSQLRNENERLRAELAEQRLVAEEFARSAQGPRRLGGENSQEEKLELMRLRNEVTQLRASAAAAREAVKDALENRDQAMQRVATMDPAGQMIGGTEFPREQWSFRGFATPEDTLVSGMWALVNGELDQVVEGLSTTEKEQWRAEAAGKTEEEVKAGISREYGNVTAVTIKEERQISPTELALKVEIQAPERRSVREVRFTLEGSEWKMQSLVNTYDPLAFYRRNPELMRRYFPHLFRGDGEQRPDAPLAEAENVAAPEASVPPQQPTLPPALMRRYFPHLQQQAPGGTPAVPQQQTKGTLPPDPSPEE